MPAVLFQVSYVVYLIVLLVTWLAQKFTDNPAHMRLAIKTHILSWGLLFITVLYQIGLNGWLFFTTSSIFVIILVVLIQKETYCSFCGRLSRFAGFFTLMNYCPECDGNKKSQNN